MPSRLLAPRTHDEHNDRHTDGYSHQRPAEDAVDKKMPKR